MTEEDEAPPGPAETMRLIESQRAAVGRSMQPDPRLTYGPWGVAWFVGFGLAYLRFGPDGRVLVDMPTWLPLAVLYVLLIGAFVVSARAGVKAGRHVKGRSSIQGLQYGLSWFAAFGAVAAIASRYGGVLPDAEVGLLWAGLSVAVVGVLYMAGAAVWQSWEMFWLGMWITFTNIGGFLAGPGWHSLVVCLAGGGGLLVGALAGWLRWRRLG